MAGRGRANADSVLLAQLATGSTIEEAASAAQVGARTIYRRLNDADFQRRLRDLRAQGLERAVSQLGGAAVAATQTLQRLLNAKSETVQLGASRAILELGVKLRDQMDLEERIRRLEEATPARPRWSA